MDARSAVLREIARSGPISRADLARKLQLSNPTVTECAKQLVGQGLVEEVEVAPSTGGRPPVLLGLVKQAATAIGVKLTSQGLVGVIVDLEGNVVRQFSTDNVLRGSKVASGLAAAIRPYVEDPSHFTLGIGIGLPGVVTAGDHGIVTSPMLGMSGVALARELERALGTPVLVDNDVNTLAVAETLYGLGRELRNFITVTIGRGIGLGIVINGEVYRGTLGAAEFGHVVIDPRGPQCECGKRGCLEASISETALVSAARQAGLIKPKDGIEKLQQLAEAGDKSALQIFSQAAALLGLAVGNLVNVLAPQSILVSGEGAGAWSLWSKGIAKALKETVFAPFAEVEIVPDLWDDSKWAQGAAALVLRAGLAPSLNDSEADRLVRTRLATLTTGEVA